MTLGFQIGILFGWGGRVGRFFLHRVGGRVGGQVVGGGGLRGWRAGIWTGGRAGVRVGELAERVGAQAKLIKIA